MKLVYGSLVELLIKEREQLRRESSRDSIFMTRAGFCRERYVY